MAELTRIEQEAISELAFHPGYQKLLEMIDAQERNILHEAEFEIDPERLLRHVRFWQFVTKINRLLHNAPAQIADELRRLAEDGQLDELPRSRNDAWRKRFSPSVDGDTVDFDDPASI